MKKYLDLFFVFAKVSFFTLGGGLAMLPLVEREVTQKHGWLTREEFLDILGISQSMPGIMILNVATTVGYKILRIRGAVCAALATILAPFVSILTIAWFFAGIKDDPDVIKVFYGIRPAVMALVLIPVISLSRAANIRGPAVFVSVAVTLAIGVLRIHPAYVILAGILAAVMRIFLQRNAP